MGSFSFGSAILPGLQGPRLTLSFCCTHCLSLNPEPPVLMVTRWLPELLVSIISLPYFHSKTGRWFLFCSLFLKKFLLPFLFLFKGGKALQKPPLNVLWDPICQVEPLSWLLSWPRVSAQSLGHNWSSLVAACELAMFFLKYNRLSVAQDVIGLSVKVPPILNSWEFMESCYEVQQNAW